MHRLPNQTWKIRLFGAALLGLATLLLAVLHPHATPRIGDGPSVWEFCLALVAVCGGCGGAALLFVGPALFEPVGDPRRPSPEEDARTERR